MPTGAPRHVKLGAGWEDAYARCRQIASEGFERDRVRNLWNGEWHAAGEPAEATSPVDGQPIAGPPMLQLDQALEAVAAANAEHQQWTKVDLDERRARVARCVDQLEAHRELLALLLVWEIGKPWRQALTSVDRTITGVRWYLEEIEPMLSGRRPLPGPVSNIASWNYPLSVLVHAMLVQLLAGNAVIAKTPTDGGLCVLTLSAAFMRRCELPVTLLSGSGSRLSPALVLNDDIGCLAFVGGRDTGGQIASQLVQTDKRHMLEQEGLNAWGIWEFSDWDTLAGHLKKGFEYGKQRCTAYPRYVVQRTLFDRFLAMYLEVARSLTFGHPLAVVDPEDEPPNLDFGPLINAAKVTELHQEIDLAIQMAATPLFRSSLAEGWFLPGQDTSAYLPPGGPARAAWGQRPGPCRAVRPRGHGRAGRLPGRAAGRNERLQRLPGGLHRLRQRAARPATGRPGPRLQGRHQRSPLQGRQGRAVRRTGGVMEGRLRGRSIPGPRRHPGPAR